MKIITELVILTLSLLLVNAHDDDYYCNNLIKNFRNKCTINSCCQLDFFSSYNTSGVYRISKGRFGRSGDAYCDMNTDGGGWIVIQRNKKGSSVYFKRTWAEYEKGFGDLHTEFWYGLEEIHYLTQRGQWEMRVDFQNEGSKSWSYLHYNQFSVGSASEKYPLTVGGYTGVAGDWFNLQDYQQRYLLNGMKFTTLDNDNDKRDDGNCAAGSSGWWYNNCADFNFNKQPPTRLPYQTQIFFTEMKIRPKDCIKH